MGIFGVQNGRPVGGRRGIRPAPHGRHPARRKRTNAMQLANGGGQSIVSTARSAHRDQKSILSSLTSLLYVRLILDGYLPSLDLSRNIGPFGRRLDCLWACPNDCPSRSLPVRDERVSLRGRTRRGAAKLSMVLAILYAASSPRFGSDRLRSEQLKSSAIQVSGMTRALSFTRSQTGASDSCFA